MFKILVYPLHIKDVYSIVTNSHGCRGNLMCILLDGASGIVSNSMIDFYKVTTYIYIFTFDQRMQLKNQKKL